MEADNGPLVPEPWTPIAARGHSVECWNREYDFGDGLLPQRITSGGVDLLAGPIRLLVKEAGLRQATWSGAEQEWTDVRYTVTKSQADVVEMTTQAASGLLQVTCKYRFEFDGMLLCDLEIAPKAGPVTVRRIDLVIPLKPQCAKLFHHCPLKPIAHWDWERDPYHSGAVPAAGLFLPFVPFIWVGDENRGLQWFAESDEGLSPMGYFVSLTPDHQLDLSLKSLTILSRDKPFRFRFGLMASPVKPMLPTDQIRWSWQIIGDESLKKDGIDPAPRLAGSAGTGINASFAVNISDLLWHAKRDPLYVEKWRELMAAAEKQGISLEACISWCPMKPDAPTSPPGITDAWLLEPRITCAVPEGDLHATCDHGGFSEWFLGAVRKALLEMGTGGLYLDGPGIPQLCTNQAHGCGYTDERGLHPTYPILAAREMMKRLYRISRAAGPRKWIVAHMSGAVILPSLSFADAILGGEHICGWYPDQNPRYTLAGFRAEMVGRQYGLPAFWLYKNQDRPTLYNALSLLHDMMPVTDGAPVAFIKAYHDFGASEARWVGYWEANGPVLATDPRLKVSSYLKPGVGTLSTVANLTGESVTSALAFDRAQLGLQSPRVKRTVASAKATVSGDGASVSLEPGGWALVEVGEGG